MGATVDAGVYGGAGAHLSRVRGRSVGCVPHSAVSQAIFEGLFGELLGCQRDAGVAVAMTVTVTVTTMPMMFMMAQLVMWLPGPR